MGRMIENTEILFTEEQIAIRVGELAAAVAGDYEALTLVGILTGAATLTSDLSRALSRLGFNNLEVDYMGVRSYDDSQESSRAPRITLDLKKPINNKNILLVEDIIDTGYSMAMLLAMLSARGPVSLEVLSLLSKEERREVNVPIKYKGFEIPDKYVFGYGTDDGYEKFRQLPYIAYKVD